MSPPEQGSHGRHFSSRKAGSRSLGTLRGVSTGAEHGCPGQLRGAPPSWELQVGRQTQTLTAVLGAHQLVRVDSPSLWRVIKRQGPFLPRLRGWTESLWRVKRAMFCKGPPVALCAWWWVLSSASGMKRFIIRTNCTSTCMATVCGTESHVHWTLPAVF